MWGKAQLSGQRGGGSLVLGLVSTWAMRHRCAHATTAHFGSDSGGHQGRRHCSRSSPHPRQQQGWRCVQVVHLLQVDHFKQVV